MTTSLETELTIFKAFSDIRRLKILTALQGGEACACDLADLLDVPQSTFSYHMKLLCDSGIVKGRQEGKWIHYSLSKEGQSNALRLLQELTTENINAAPLVSSC